MRISGIHAPTLSDTPLQLCENVGQQYFTERLVKLGEHVTDGVKRVVTRRRHPLGFLEANEKREQMSTFSFLNLPLSLCQAVY